MIVGIALAFAFTAASNEPEGWRQALEASMKEDCVSGGTSGKSYSADQISAVTRYCGCTSAVYAKTITYDELVAASKAKSWQDAPKLDNRLSVAADMQCETEIKAAEAAGIK